jgi:homoserine O-succinyltransferase
MQSSRRFKVAIIDMYAGAENQGMRCLREIVQQFAEVNFLDIQLDEFELRVQHQIPDTDYDVYISTGGPGSPLESEGSEWERLYFEWLAKMEAYNNDENNKVKKHIFLICHSFQLVSRHYKIGLVTKRKSTSFGIFPIHLMEDAATEPIFEGLNDPFYAVDSRDYQLIQPDLKKIRSMGAKILALEKNRPHVPLERAIMAVRFSPYMVGTQFHPEADATGMLLHLQTPERKKIVSENYGMEKWESMITQLNDPDKIMYTYAHIFPNFLSKALGLTSEIIV